MEIFLEAKLDPQLLWSVIKQNMGYLWWMYSNNFIPHMSFS
jgi:hypothetical protein